MSLVDVVSWLFSALSIAALSFFLHKVAWLVRYKNLQRDLLHRAAEAEEGARLEATKAWDDFAAAAWRVARGPAALDEGEVQGPDAYADAVEAELSASVDAVEARRPVRDVILETLKRTRRGDVLHHVVEVPSRRDERARASLCIDPPLVAEPPAPPEDAFTLDVKSRYGFWRRALVFVTGLADVVYSSSHVAKMSQYAHVPLGTLLRRLSLVVLLAVGIVLEVVLGLRDALAASIARHAPKTLGASLGLPPEWQDRAPELLALVLWTAGVAAIYFTMFFVVRSRARRHLEELLRLQREQGERLAAIRQRHERGLLSWATSYAETLDGAIDLSARHVALLAQHYAARCRRRLAGEALVDAASRMSDALFEHLPEAQTGLVDRINARRHSFAHSLWPRADEMQEAVAQASLRGAWQRLELGLSELRRGLPEPTMVARFWRELASLAAIFDEVLPNGTDEALRASYVTLVEDTSRDTEADLARFDTQVRELVGHLDEQLGAATHLLDARVELTNQRIVADAAALHAEVVRCREAARLEAMAFEI